MQRQEEGGMQRFVWTQEEGSGGGVGKSGIDGAPGAQRSTTGGRATRELHLSSLLCSAYVGNRRLLACAGSCLLCLHDDLPVCPSASFSLSHLSLFQLPLPPHTPSPALPSPSSSLNHPPNLARPAPQLVARSAHPARTPPTHPAPPGPSAAQRVVVGHVDAEARATAGRVPALPAAGAARGDRRCRPEEVSGGGAAARACVRVRAEAAFKFCSCGRSHPRRHGQPCTNLYRHARHNAGGNFLRRGNYRGTCKVCI